MRNILLYNAVALQRVRLFYNELTCSFDGVLSVWFDESDDAQRYFRDIYNEAHQGNLQETGKQNLSPHLSQKIEFHVC